MASLNLTTLSVGSHSITAVYSGDSTYSVVSNNLSQNVNAASTSTTLTSSVNTTTFFQNITFNASIAVTTPGAGSPTGSMDFYEGLTLIDVVPVVGGVAIFTTPGLATGSQTITAEFTGSGSFTGSSSNTIVQTVNQVASTTTLAPPASTVHGQFTTFTATVTQANPGAVATGIVLFADAGIVFGVGYLVNGVATFTTNGLTTRSHSISASYMGDINTITSSSAAASMVVSQATSRTTLTSTTLRTNVTFVATVAAVAPGAGVPSGTLGLYANGRLSRTLTLVNGRATLTLTTAQTRGITWTARYNGSADFFGSDSSTVVFWAFTNRPFSQVSNRPAVSRTR